MEKNQTFGFICLNNIEKYSFAIMLSKGEIELMTLYDLIKLAKDKAIKLGSGIGKLYDLYGKIYEENSDKVKENPVSYYQDLFPFKFHEPNKITIKVTFYNDFKNINEVKEIEIFPFSTVEVLKDEVYKAYDCPPQEQSLLFGEVKLEDPSYMLTEYSIKAGSTIKLAIAEVKENNRSFVDVTKNKYKDRNFSKNAPKWRICTTGINIEGNCLNKKCEAYNKSVTCPMKNKEVFDLIQDSDEVVCPICKQNFEPQTCGFTGCSYTFAGIKIEKGKKTKVIAQSQIMNRVGNIYRLFDPTESGKVEWQSLKIIVKFDVPDLNETDAQSVFCALCNESDILNGGSIKKKDGCDKYFHDGCYDKVKTISSFCYIQQI